MKKIKEFFKDVKKEISKVKWPTKKNMVKYSLTMFVCVVFFSIFLGIGFNYCLCKGIGGLVWKIISYGM